MILSNEVSEHCRKAGSGWGLVGGELSNGSNRAKVRGWLKVRWVAKVRGVFCGKHWGSNHLVSHLISSACVCRWPLPLPLRTNCEAQIKPYINFIDNLEWFEDLRKYAKLYLLPDIRQRLSENSSLLLFILSRQWPFLGAASPSFGAPPAFAV